MSIFRAFDISSSGMTAQRFRSDIIAQNVANETTTRTSDGTPYRRKVVAFQEKNITDFSHVLDSVRESDKMIGNGVKLELLQRITVQISLWNMILLIQTQTKMDMYHIQTLIS